MPVGWFVLLMLAGGFLSSVQSLTIGLILPIEIGIRVLLVLQFIIVIFIKTGQHPSLSFAVKFGVIVFGLSMMSTPLLSLYLGMDGLLVLRTMYFMSGIGILLVLGFFVQINISGGAAFRLFALACILFGSLQAFSQNLLLTEQVKAAFGLQFELFSNGQLRVVSFFASAPRFAEFLVFCMLYIFFQCVHQRKPIFFSLVLFAVCGWLLYNTFSRAGYVLMISGLLSALILSRRKLLGPANSFVWLSRLFILFCIVLGLVAFNSLIDIGALGINDQTSMFARISTWMFEIEGLWQLSPIQFIFGTGEAPLFSRSEADYFAIDNLFLILLRYSGLLGFLSFLFMYIVLLDYAWRRWIAHNDPFLGCLIAFVIGLAFESIFVDNHNTLYLVMFVILCRVGRQVPSRGQELGV